MKRAGIAINFVMRQGCQGMKFIFNVVAFGIIPTYLALKDFGWLWWIGYVILLIALFIVLGMVHTVNSHRNAAANIVMATATIQTLDKRTRKKVEEHAKHIHAVYETDPDANFDNDMERSAYWALAMGDMEIEPVILYEYWFDVRNPSDIPPDFAITHMMQRVSDELGSAKVTENSQEPTQPKS